MNFAVIMAGGKGTRFWPKSRRLLPKQFLNIHSGQPMIEDTLRRVRPLVNKKNILIVTNKDQVAALKALRLRLQPSNIIAEPVGRNTAPCLGLAALCVRKRSKKQDAVMIALPADHLITQEKRFTALLAKAVRVAQKDDCIVTLGIKPAYPETGYGYIELCKKVSNKGSAVHNVKRFVEKPTIKKAREYVRTGRFCWNAGILVCRASVLLKAIATHMPQLNKGLLTIDKDLGTSKETRTIARVFKALKSESIDYGVMEEYSKVKLLVADVGWNDLGSWRVLADIARKDGQGNAAHGKALFVDARNNYVSTERQLVALLGVDDLVVVATDDALLIVKKDKSQDVKKVTKGLARPGLRSYL
jgi:mannose-1-phosphate guanylyltransferase